MFPNIQFLKFKTMKIISFFQRISEPVDVSEINDEPSLLIETKCYTPAELLKYAVAGMDVSTSFRDDEIPDDMDDFETGDDPLVSLAQQQEFISNSVEEINSKAQNKDVDESKASDGTSDASAEENVSNEP